MRKILSVVLAVLMVSMIIPTMSFAAAAGIEDISGLVAGETFTVTPTSAATISVNAKVFDIVDVADVADATIETIEVAADTAVELKVRTSVPVEFTSEIKVVVGDTTEYVKVSVADRYLGDVNNDNEANILDITQILYYGAYGDEYDGYAEEFNAAAGDVNRDGDTNILDITQILLYGAYGADSDQLTAKGFEKHIGGASTDAVVDPWVSEPQKEELAAPTGLYAYHQNGTVYFTFDSVKGATGYTVKVGDGEEQTFTATSGSVTAAYPAEGTLAITVVAKGDGTTTTDSKAATTNVVDATVSGELATWLSQNGLSDVAITVYEITE